MPRARLIAGLAILLAGPGLAQTIVSARYTEPTERYGHAVLGDAVEYGALTLQVENAPGALIADEAGLRRTTYHIRLPLDRVFEDVAPRLVDLDGNGTREAMVVETDVARGAQLAIYDAKGRKLAATPHIGRTKRWLAPIGAADLDGDGRVEIAYIDRPHLAKTLRIWRYENHRLIEIAALDGLSNHRIGWDFIAGGIRTCAGAPEIVTADGAWSRVVATRLTDAKLQTRDIGLYDGPESLRAAMLCR